MDRINSNNEQGRNSATKSGGDMGENKQGP